MVAFMTSKLLKCQLLWLRMGLILMPAISTAQHLGKPVNLNVINLPVSEVLEAIAHESQFYFSYSSRLIPKDSLISADFSGMTVSDALIKLFGTKYRYVEKPYHLIILPARQELVELEGSVHDYGSGEAIASAFLYAANGQFLTTSDVNGSFSLAVPVDKFPLNLSVRKMSYRDTTLLINKFAHHPQVLLASSPITLEPVLVRERQQPATGGETGAVGLHFRRRWLQRLWKRKRCASRSNADKKCHARSR